jgi:ribosomal RNA assembly protein
LDAFLTQHSFQTQTARESRQIKKKQKSKWKTKKEYTPFPPPQLPSKVDKMLETGEYFAQQQSNQKSRKPQKEQKPQKFKT